MATDWLNLRHWNGSQETAFQKHCGQLLMDEPAPPGIVFISKGTPDAGIEGYGSNPDDKEWAYQAKFFLTALTEIQWKQLDESVETALTSHPNLTKYTICIPQDRSDPRVKEQKWFMDKWNDRVRKWEDLASHRGMKVSFDYWGDSELLFKLSQEQHRGKWLFWFNKQLLTIAWMKQRVDEAVKNSGPRYTPEINVEVPIREVFEGVARTPEFFGMFEQFRARLTKSMRRVARGGNDAASQIISVGITKTSDLLRAIDNAVAQRNAEQIDELQTKCEDASRAAWDAIGRLSGLERSDESAKGLPRPHSDSKYSHERYFLRELTAVLSDCVEFCDSGTVRCARSRALLLSGTAGMGKTHLMCDVALSRLARKLPTLLLLGNHFRNTEPITQIAQEILGMQLSKDDFLSALDAAGAAGYGHTLILVDGINEGDGRTLWHKHVAGFLTAIKPYKHIAVALSVRTTYRDLLIPASIPDAELTRVSHPGFAGHEYRATETFFDHYKLKAPSIPLLNPEFDNPQFLKLFCETLVNTGHTEVPRDLPGIAAVFDEFVSSVNNKISAPNIADFDPEDNLVQRAVHGLIDNMAAHGRTWVTRADAKQIVEGILSGRQYSRSLYRFLKDESVIYDDIEPIPKAKPLEVVRFSFERFTDHLLAKLLLDGIASSEQLSQEFKKGGKLFPYFENKRVVYQHKGLLEAMMIEVPEKIGHEVLVVAPQFASETPALDAFFDGILWRHPRTINERTLEQLNKVSGTHPEGSKKCFDLMLLLAATPNHPWNAKFLHRNLLRQSLTERDATWSIYVFDRYKQQGPIDRLIDWASSESAKSHLDDESILLAGIALSWFLTTSHRFVRDHATKALVALFSTRLPLLAALLEEFRSVNDPYVLQRLYAVAYGCAMRSTDHKGIGQLAEKTFELVFAGGTPYPDILLRDYARGVIETALHQNCKLSFDADAARPPYTSEWEDAEFASGELENWSSTKDDMPDRDWNRYHLYQSIMGSEDFARYIIGTNHGSFEWSSQRLKEVKKTKSNERRRRPDEADRFSLKLLQRWILRRVIDLGWTVERFGEFDRRVSHFADVGRGEHKPERIGKKYQWIAYHEALARISDNFVFIGDHWAERNEEYEGPWQVGFVRDIDPSCLIRETMAYRDEVTWWQPLRYDSWELAKSDVAWLKTTADVPDPKSIITVTDSQGVGWVTLEGYPAFEQPLPKYEDRFGVPRRQLWIQIRSYIVRKRDASKFFRWAQEQDFGGRWMPESHSPSRLFLGEYFWSPAFRYFKQPYYQREPWVHEGRLPCPVLIATDGYSQSVGYDCSINDTLNLSLPSGLLYDELELLWRAEEGVYRQIDLLKTVIDPTVSQPGPTAVLIRREALTTLLEREKYDIFWVVLGEKNVLGIDRHEDWPGRLEVCGAYAFRRGKLVGNLRFKNVQRGNSS